MLLTNGFEPDMRVYKQALHMTGKGLSVTVFCWDRQSRLPEEESIDGIQVRRCKIPAVYGTGFRQLPAFFHFLWVCMRYVSITKWDYLHCSDLDAMLIAFFCKKARIRKWIFDMHEFYDSGTLSKFKWLVNPLVTFLCSKATYVIFLNHLQLVYAKKCDRLKFIYLPNYPQWTKFANIRQTNHPKIRIAYIGVVRQFEALKVLLNECHPLSRHVEINIHGLGIATQALAELTAKIGFGTVTGQFDYENVGSLYANADVIFCMYDYDDHNASRAYATKLYEAIVARCPVIVQKGTVMADFVSKHNIGFCVDLRTPGSIAEEIYKCATDKSIIPRLVKNAEKIRHRFVWEKIVTNLDVIFEEGA